MELSNFSRDSLIAELDRRYSAPRVKFPADVLQLSRKKIGNKKTENFAIITLDGAHGIIKFHIITTGLVNRCMIHPREVFVKAIKDMATAIIAVHNHPSGNVAPSKEDKELTGRLKEAGKILGISLLDSVIISKYSFYSFLDEGEL
jgi:DNA repair protein RadC